MDGEEPALEPVLDPGDKPGGEVDHDESPPLPWEQQPQETAAAFAAFVIYRDLRWRRSLDAVTRRLNSYDLPNGRQKGAKTEPGEPALPSKRRSGQVSRLSREHNWPARAAAWDSYLDNEARLAQVEAIRDMTQRHAALARALQGKALTALRAMTPNQMDASDVLRFLVEAAKLERLALGEATEHTRQEVQSTTHVALEVVERIVPVRGSSPTPALPVVTSNGGVDATSVPAPAIEGDLVIDDGAGDGGDFELPDEPPEALGQHGGGS